MADALEILDQVAHWPALVQVDVTGDVARQWEAIAHAAAGGDPQRLIDPGYDVNCSTIQPGFRLHATRSVDRTPKDTVGVSDTDVR